MSSENVAIGIDLGTSNSCVGVIRNGRVELIANDMGFRVTPSYVSFADDGSKLIGNGAKDYSADNDQNTVFDVKRLIGRTYDDRHVQEKMDLWPFTVKNDRGSPKVEVEIQGEKMMLAPEEISSMVLMKMKEIAEEFVGASVTDAVITVPAYFNDSQREATMDAGAIAGLNVLSILNEPVAAAIAYGVDKKVTDSQKVLVFDLGGGTFDVAILEIRNENFEVLAVTGDSLLGGGNFDERLMIHCQQEFRRKNKKDMPTDSKTLQALRAACEKAKMYLSTGAERNAKINVASPGVELDCMVSRDRFELLCSDLFKKTLRSIETVLKDTKLKKSDIDEVLLIGGSTRIPKIRNLLETFFQGKNINKTINPDEAVAYGATIFAATLIGDTSVHEIFLTDVTPLSIGIKVLGGKMSTIIHRNSKLPTKNTKQYTTTCHNQTNMEIKVYEGLDNMTVNNHLLGEFCLSDIQLALKGIPTIDVTFDVNRNGILNVTAVDTSSKDSKKSIKITSNKGRLNKQEIEAIIAKEKGK